MKTKIESDGPVSVLRGLLRVERTDGLVIEVCDSHPVYGRVTVTFSPEHDGRLSVGVQIRSTFEKRALGPSILTHSQSESVASAIGAMLDGE